MANELILGLTIGDILWLIGALVGALTLWSLVGYPKWHVWEAHQAGLADLQRAKNEQQIHLYLRWQWIKMMEDTGSDNSVIYVPTEANLPILEAGRNVVREIRRDAETDS